MYNEERKRRFIEEKSKEAVVTNNIRDFFILSEKFEEEKGRDLCEWNTHEIIDLYKYYSTPNIQTLILLNNALTIYTNWCINNGLVADNQNHFSEIKSEHLCECIDFNAFEQRVFTRDTLIGWLQQLPNYVDRFIFLGIFEGIPVLNGYLTDVKIGDLNGNLLTLSNGHQRVLSDTLVNIMHEATTETVRCSMGEQLRNRDVEYEYGETIIRPAAGSSYTNNKPTLLVGSRIRACCKFLGIDNLQIKTISECGRMWYINELSKKNKCSVEEVMVKYRSKHEEIYGKVQNMITYSLTFGKMIKDLYG